MTKIAKRRAVKCPYCDSLNTIKKGIRKDVKKPVTRYLCKDCGKKFQSKHREVKVDIKEKIFKDFFWKKKTLKTLAEEFTLSKRIIQEYINNFEVKIKKKKPREIILIVDVVFFDKRKYKSEFGIMVFYDVIEREVILWKEVITERLSDYKTMFFEIIKLGFTVKAVVIDGKKGLKEFLDEQNILVQYCQFHQIKTIISYLTKKPKLPASIHLKLLVSFLTDMTEDDFKKEFKYYIENFKDVINEVALNPKTNKYYYVHKRLRSAVKSLIKNLPYLFTYKKYPELKIPNTTNSLDGGEFSYLKRLLRNHNGVSRELKIKMINEYFENHKSYMKKRKK